MYDTVHFTLQVTALSRYTLLDSNGFDALVDGTHCGDRIRKFVQLDLATVRPSTALGAVDRSDVCFNRLAADWLSYTKSSPCFML